MYDELFRLDARERAQDADDDQRTALAGIDVDDKNAWLDTAMAFFALDPRSADYSAQRAVLSERWRWLAALERITLP